MATAIRYRDAKMLVNPGLQANQLPGYVNRALGAHNRAHSCQCSCLWLLSATGSRVVVMETMWPESLKSVLLGSARQSADPVLGGQPSIPQIRAPYLAERCP